MPKVSTRFCEKTLFVGKPIIEFDELGSTNAYAETWLTEPTSKSKPNEGTVISAANQTEGRGQIGSRWLSEPHKNIAVSAIFYPNFLTPSQQFYLNKTIALAVRETVVQILTDACPMPPPPVSIKWSNDIYVENKKIGGILIQNQLKINELEYSIVGIGLNLHQTSFDPSLPNPTSLARATAENGGGTLSISYQSAIDLLCQSLESAYLQLKSAARRDNFSKIDAQYWQFLYRLNQPATFRRCTDQSTLEGRIVGTSDNGKLMVENLKNQKIELFDIKEIQFL